MNAEVNWFNAYVFITESIEGEELELAELLLELVVEPVVDTL